MAEQDASQRQREVKTEEMEIPVDSMITERIERYNRYRAEYARRIKAKYFSKKAPNGVDVFEKETSIDGEIIKSSRDPCTKLFIESFNNTEDIGKLLGSGSEIGKLPGSGAEASASTSARKPLSKRSN